MPASGIVTNAAKSLLILEDLCGNCRDSSHDDSPSPLELGVVAVAQRQHSRTALVSGLWSLVSGRQR
jgi:hypothetical protein